MDLDRSDGLLSLGALEHTGAAIVAFRQRR